MLFKISEWALRSARLIQDSIQVICNKQGHCSVMLTGGQSAESLYLIWRDLPEFKMLKCVSFYFGDERCVSPVDSASNYGLVMRTLFAKGTPLGHLVFRMETDAVDQEHAAVHYESILPSKIDILLLGVGEDGHIASLFPYSAPLYETLRRVVPVTGPKPPFERFTITPPVIKNAGQVFVLALGEQKRTVYEEALHDPSNIYAIPARLVLNRTWIFGG